MKINKFILLFVCFIFIACNKDNDNALPDTNTSSSSNQSDKKTIWCKYFDVLTGDSTVYDFEYSGNTKTQIVSTNSQYTLKSVTTDDGNLWTHSEYSYENNNWVWGHTTTIKYIGDHGHSLWDDMLYANGYHVRSERIYNGDDYESFQYEDNGGERTLTSKTEFTQRGNTSTTILYRNDAQLIPFLKIVETKNPNSETKQNYQYENGNWALKSTQNDITKKEGNRTTYHEIEYIVLGRSTYKSITEYTYNGDNTTSISYNITDGIKEYNEKTESSRKENYIKRIKYKYIDNQWVLYRIEEMMYE